MSRPRAAVCLETALIVVPTYSISLHAAYEYPGAQFYPSCIQVEVTGSGTAFPTDFVAFPGAYTPDT